MKQYLEKIVASIGDGQAPIDYEVDADYDVDVKGCVFADPVRLRAVIERIRVYHNGVDLTAHLSDETVTAAECIAAAEIETRHGCVVAIGEAAR